MKLDDRLVASLEQIAREAGDKILEIYESDDFDVEAKGDGSPLTGADRAAHEHIVDSLQTLTPDIPILSEESRSIDVQDRQQWSTFWLVDPLDGTKEFIKRNGEFTVNIALIVERAPVFGVVYAPVLGICYLGGKDYGAWRMDTQGERQEIAAASYAGGPATVVASRSHRGEAVDAFLERLAQQEGEPQVRSMGSSLKICLVAEGAAHVYPRLGPTSEWDTAAAHAVVMGAGGQVLNTDGQPLLYNKDSILNPWFLVVGAGPYDWTQFTPAAPTQ